MISRAGCPPRPPPPNFTTSRRRHTCGSCVTRASMMRSASRPYMQCLALLSHSGCSRAHRMCSIILCSPSPRTSGPLSTTTGLRHTGSSVCLRLTKKARCWERRAMNSVPGVMQLESNGCSGTDSPRASFAALSACASRAERKRRERCWFILARGATPSMAMYSVRVGLIMWHRWSRYAKTFTMSCSSLGAAPTPSPCEQLWMTPFMSR
mmetsp:Transcript_27481/g.93825  ORF Transcript_27481/g.93825 Transcript_27481/m.93825 type:complete len:209 (-) Transcript_27481:132-758(-)